MTTVYEKVMEATDFSPFIQLVAEKSNKMFHGDNFNGDSHNHYFDRIDTDSDETDDSDEYDIEEPPEEKYYLSKVLGQDLFLGKCSLEVQQKDPNSPLHSVKSFDALHLKPELLRGVYAMGFNSPSRIQETALPTLLADPPQNMIAQSQSGTGKTAAFVLTMLSRVNPKLNYPQVLCISPTYELAIQTGEVAARMAQFCPTIRLRYAVRGEEVGRSMHIYEHILIGTPGKLLDWSVKYRLFDLNKIALFVLDEADVMINTQGHHDQCIRIHKRLSRACQMLFFSATYDKEVMDFARLIVQDPTIIRLLRQEESLVNVKQYYVVCNSNDTKYKAIQNIYNCISIGQGIIFCYSRRTAAWLASKLCVDGHSVSVLSGDLTIDQRLAVLDRFRCGLEKLLVTTNVLSRGIDIEQVTLVVNFDLPIAITGRPDYETYLHRIGRTGRFGKEGIAINLVDDKITLGVCRSIERHFEKPIKRLNTDNFEETEKIGAYAVVKDF